MTPKSDPLHSKGESDDAATCAFLGSALVVPDLPAAAGRLALGEAAPHHTPGSRFSTQCAVPDPLPDRDKIAYGLVPKAMDTFFGQQGTAWKTEKSKSGSGYTTWIVQRQPSAA